jgi:hypothetical protein
MLMCGTKRQPGSIVSELLSWRATRQAALENSPGWGSNELVIDCRACAHLSRCESGSTPAICRVPPNAGCRFRSCRRTGIRYFNKELATGLGQVCICIRATGLMSQSGPLIAGLGDLEDGRQGTRWGCSQDGRLARALIVVAVGGSCAHKGPCLLRTTGPDQTTGALTQGGFQATGGSQLPDFRLLAALLM